MKYKILSTFFLFHVDKYSDAYYSVPVQYY